ncbi:MAG: G5 domain-containing protein [Parcubacteria group bacterium]
MKKIFIILFLIAATWAICSFVGRPDRELDLNNSAKIISLNDNGFSYNVRTSSATIEDFLKENDIVLGEHDQIIPEKNTPLLSGMNISIKRALKIKLLADGKNSEVYTLENSAGGALWENKISLGEDDIVKPDLNYSLHSGDKIEVIRVDIREETANESIPYATKRNEDDNLSWRIKKVTQKGINGINEIRYKVVSYNGKEISRKILSQNVTKDPVNEIVTQGTYMKLGKAKTGQGTWYAFKGGLFAASTTLPRGSYAKVTNTENGQSVIVQINDYGPQGKGRIIDLDKVAFAKIASLGAGVIGVKVEPILN